MKLSEENQALLIQLQTLHDKGELHGMFPNIPNEVYHHPDCPGVSKSNLDSVNKSYNHYLQSIENARKEQEEPDFKDKFFVGTAFHTIVLEPELFDKTYACPPIQPKFDRRTKEGKAGYEEWVSRVLEPWEAENAGKARITEELMTQLNSMRNSVLAHAKIRNIIENSAKEVTFFWRDAKTGLTCRCRPDAISMEYGIVLDLKSTAMGADFVSFRRAMANYNYDKQAAFYLDGVKAVTGRDMQFIFCATEKEAPFGTQAFLAIEPIIDVGRQLYRKSLDKISAVHQGKEPKGYSQDIIDIDLPAWGYDVEARS
jgi:hypothetical protein